MASLIITINERKQGFDLTAILGKVTVIGYDDACDITLNGVDGLSHRLCSITCTKEGFMLEDLDSTNGTYANEKEVREMLERVGLAGRLDSPCGQLSLGQQQRVAFVRALCQPADFIFLDEPVSHIDEVNALTMAQMLKERQQKDGVGVIVTSIGYRLPYDYDNVLKL